MGLGGERSFGRCLLNGLAPPGDDVGNGDLSVVGHAPEVCFGSTAVDRQAVTQSGPRAHRIAFRKVAVLDHRDTSKRERRSIVAQRHAAQGAEGITRFERTCRSCNQRLHLNTATLVTPTVRFPVPNYLTTNNER